VSVALATCSALEELIVDSRPIRPVRLCADIVAVDLFSCRLVAGYVNNVAYVCSFLGAITAYTVADVSSTGRFVYGDISITIIRGKLLWLFSAFWCHIS
jgi:hypothetical protein